MVAVSYGTQNDIFGIFLYVVNLPRIDREQLLTINIATRTVKMGLIGSKYDL